MHIHIKNGRVIDPAQHLNEICDVYVVDGIIAGISEAPAGFSAEQTLDASGHIVCPGLIDMSAHTREPGFSRKGSISTESTAAVAGGITTLVTPPNTKPIIDTTAVAELIIERSEDVAKARVLPMGALTSGLKGEHLSPMFALSESGCIAFTNMRAPITSSLILTRCLEYAATHDLLVVFQPQDAALAAGGHMHEDTTCTRLGLNGIPETAETIEVSRCLLLAEQTGVRAHFGQLSCEKSVRMVMEARQRGLNVSVDVAIHHLLLIDEHVDGFDSNFHLIPPLRSQLDRAGLRQALLAGGIQ
ncbi:MAG: dihydroorotase, partial [Pontibacterium sp.]